MIGEAADQAGVLTMPTAEAPYRQIANDLTARIKSGDLKPGDKLPSTRELAEQYKVHMNTASRALSLLHDRELIIGQPGRGTYVWPSPPPSGKPQSSFGADVMNESADGSSRDPRHR